MAVDIREKSYSFALQIISFYKTLQDRNEYVLSRQLLRSGTSIGANVEEAGAGLSRADFLSKMSIASKEARETHYWLRLIRDSEFAEAKVADPLISEAESIINILTAIVKTTAQAKKRF
jgi:four helix bundle protein